MSLLEIRKLNVDFRISGDVLHAVKNLDAIVNQSETVSMVGESGSGKSVLVSAVFGILEKNSSVDGEILFGGRDLLSIPRKEFDLIRRKELVLIPQNVSQAWDPMMRIGDQMREFMTNAGIPEQDVPGIAKDYLSQCGFEDPRQIMDTYPHRLSGGMSQRAMIAMCMSVEPSLVVADEPTKGIDESAKEGILDLLTSEKWGSSLLMITHDIGSASRCKRIMVMYAGRCVESGNTAEVLENPLHPYTKGLIGSDPRRGLNPIPFASRDLFPGECSFGNRCSLRDDGCDNSLFVVDGREVRCRHAGGRRSDQGVQAQGLGAQEGRRLGQHDRGQGRDCGAGRPFWLGEIHRRDDGYEASRAQLRPDPAGRGRRHGHV